MPAVKNKRPWTIGFSRWLLLAWVALLPAVLPAQALLRLKINLQQSPGFQAHHLDTVLEQRHFPGLDAASNRLRVPPNRLDIKAYHHPIRLPWTEECLPLFCRIEHKMGKRSAVPLKFRLGSVEYVDWLEGKRPAP